MSDLRIQRRLFAVSFVCGFIITLFCLSPHAYENPDIEIASEDTPATITIDVNNQIANVNYKEVDRYLESMAKQKVQYAKAKQNTIILAEKQIEVPPYLAKPAVAPLTQPIPYMPHELVDLGMEVTPDANIIKSENIQLADHQLVAVPTVPEFIPPPFIAPNIAAIKVYSMMHNQLSSASTSSSIYDLSRAAFAGAGFVIICLLLLSRVRKTIRERKAAYAGMLGDPTALVGSGKIFDFKDAQSSMQTMPVNSTYLSMMWHLGRFTQENGVNTYFYMAYYIPPQMKYAAILRRKRKTEKEIST